MITLNTAEQRLAKFVGRERDRNGRRNGYTNLRIGPQSDEETDLEGIAAEIFG